MLPGSDLTVSGQQRRKDGGHRSRMQFFREGVSGQDAHRPLLPVLHLAQNSAILVTGPRNRKRGSRCQRRRYHCGHWNSGQIRPKTGVRSVPFLPAGQSSGRLFFLLPGGLLWSRRAMSRNPPTIPSMRSSSRFCQLLPRAQDLHGMAAVPEAWAGQGLSRTTRRSASWPVGVPASASSHSPPIAAAMSAAALAISGRWGWWNRMRAGRLYMLAE